MDNRHTGRMRTRELLGYWWIRRVFALVPAQTYVGEYVETFEEFPPRQKPAKFNLDDAIQALANVGNN